jgi:hypothetical protein
MPPTAHHQAQPTAPARQATGAATGAATNAPGARPRSPRFVEDLWQYAYKGPSDLWQYAHRGPSAASRRDASQIW